MILIAMLMGAALPPDVAAFIQRRTECNHWAGEEPYDGVRAREIDRAMARLNCAALETDQKRLLRRHAGNPDAVGEILDAEDAE